MDTENNQNHGHKLIKLTHKERIFQIPTHICTILKDALRIGQFPVR